MLLVVKMKYLVLCTVKEGGLMLAYDLPYPDEAGKAVHLQDSKEMAFT